MTTATRIKQLREACGLSQEGLAQATVGTLSRNYISKVEIGHNKASSFKVRTGLARGFGLTLEEMSRYLDNEVTIEATLYQRETRRRGESVAADRPAPGASVDRLEERVQKLHDRIETITQRLGEIIQTASEMKTKLAAVTAERDALLAERRPKQPADGVVRSLLLRDNGIIDTGQTDDELQPLARVYPRTPREPVGSKTHSCPDCGVHHNNCPECGCTMGERHSGACPWNGVQLRVVNERRILGTRPSTL